MMLMLPSCASMSGQRIDSIDTSCRAFYPITFSRRDTEETREQILRHDKIFDSLCPSGHIGD